MNNKNIDIEAPSYVKKIFRDNVGYDFGGWSEALLINELYKKYDKFIFVNSSVIGPFLQSNFKGNWTDIYIHGLQENVKLFGSTINTCYDPLNKAHVQSYIFAMDKKTLEYLIECKIFSTMNHDNSFYNTIWNKEVLMSKKIIEKGWNIGSLLPCYKNVDFTFSNKDHCSYNINFLDDVMYNRFRGSLWNEYDLVFIKGNRDIQGILDVPIDVTLDEFLIEITNNKLGVEIGGPSNNANIIYKNAINIDNVIFSKDTIWGSHTNEYNFYYNKKGKVIINDAVDISLVQNESYDFCFASHSLENIANPLKAINEWLRIIKNNGYIIIVVPEKSACFDHKRKYSKFSTLLSQFKNNVGEDDLSTLPEILMNHDLSMDPPAGDLGAFTKRSLDNFNNRCLHHYVYNDDLLMEICNYFKCKYIFKNTQGLDRWFIMKKI